MTSKRIKSLRLQNVRRYIRLPHTVTSFLWITYRKTSIKAGSQIEAGSLVQAGSSIEAGCHLMTLL